MKKAKLLRILWLFSGFGWGFIFLNQLSTEGTSMYLFVIGSIIILSFIIAYIMHRKVIKENEKEN